MSSSSSRPDAQSFDTPVAVAGPSSRPISASGNDTEITGTEAPTASRQSQVASGTIPPACDACRSRKVRCQPLEGQEEEEQTAAGSGIKCKLCVKRKEACTYEYVYKKPGRPIGSNKRSRKSATPDDAASSPSSARHQRHRTATSQPDDTQRPASSPSYPFSSNYTRLLDSRSNSPRFDYSTPPQTVPTNLGHSAHIPPYTGVRMTADPILGESSASRLDAATIPPYSSTYGPNGEPGPATGTIFGSALSAMHSDQSFSDLFSAPFGAVPNAMDGHQQGAFMADTSMGRPSHLNTGFYPGDSGLMPGIMVDLGPGARASTRGGHDARVPTQQMAIGQEQSRPLRPWTDQSPVTQPQQRSSANGGYTNGRAYHSTDVSGSAPRQVADIGSPNTGTGDTPRIPHPATRPDIPQIESVAPWQDICFFLSLHMKHQHGLMPLVHKPTFAQDVLQRRDLGDEVFRGLLCSIVSYTICQLPIQLTSHKYARNELELLLRRCQRTSRAIQLRWHMAPCLESLASLQLDTNTALACTQLDLASALISDIRRQVYSLGLHKAEPREGLDFLQVQICRRLFWEVYQSDKTNVMNAISPISLNDLEGVPPHPLEIDDDYLTSTTSTPQPSGRISYMTGFNAVSRIFEILGQCQIRQRTWSNNPSAGPGRSELSRWVDDAQLKMRDVLHELPKALRAEGGGEKGGFDKADESSLGIQRANIHITALCVDFALLDFKVHLRPELDTKAEREQLARKAYTTLSSVPIEYLASNGESMRGKVLRIVLDLLSNCPEPGIFGQDVWNWWNMYSQVQFFQIIPEKEQNEGEPTDDRPPSSAGPRDL